MEMPAAYMQVVWTHSSITCYSVSQSVHIILEQFYCYCLSRKYFPIILKGSMTRPFSKPFSTYHLASSRKQRETLDENLKIYVWSLMNNWRATWQVHCIEVSELKESIQKTYIEIVYRNHNEVWHIKQSMRVLLWAAGISGVKAPQEL